MFTKIVSLQIITRGSAAANAAQTRSLSPQAPKTTATANSSFRSLLEAFKRSQVSHPASSALWTSSPLVGPAPPSQGPITQQLTKHWPQLKALRQHYASTRFEAQRQLHLPQKHRATVPESSLRVERPGDERPGGTSRQRQGPRPLLEAPFMARDHPALECQRCLQPQIYGPLLSPRR